MALGQQPAALVERVVTAATVAEGLVLDAAPALVELGVRVLHQMERISDLRGVRERVGEGLAVGARQVQHAPCDAVAPRLRLGFQPRQGTGGGAARDHVEQLGRASDIDDRGAPVLAAPAAGASEQRLVQAQGGDWPDPVGVLDQRCAVGSHGVHDGVPVTPELAGDLSDGAALAADLHGDPPAGPIRHRRPRGGDPRVGLGPRAHLALRFGAAPAALAPHQYRRPPERRQVHQRDRRSVLHPRPGAAPGAPVHLGSGLNVDPQRSIGPVLHAHDGHVGQSDEERAHTRSVGLQQGLRRVGWRSNR